MAWIVIVSGFLLALGGGFSLLMGFDIVVTERGSAMTIGGVIALSGGVIAMGIGSALLKLKAILRALEARAGRTPRAAASDRPVVPLQADVPPPPPHAAEAMTGAGAGIAAGLAAGAAIRRAQAPEQEQQMMPASEPSPIAPEPAVMAEAAPRPDAAEAAAMERRPAPPDLEEELSRALAEIDDPPRPRRSFADGLQEFMDHGASAADRHPELKAQEPRHPFETAAMAREEHESPPTMAGERRERQAFSAGEAAISVSGGAPGAADSLEPAERYPDILAPDVPAQQIMMPEVMTPEVMASDSSATDDESPDVAGSEVPTAADVTPARLAHQAQEPASQQEDAAAGEIAGGAMPASAGEGGMTAEQTELAPALPAPQPAPRQHAVLGSYSIGGRTYRMFADGSVEAETESGVQRFTSMDELRRHLAGG